MIIVVANRPKCLEQMASKYNGDKCSICSYNKCVRVRIIEKAIQLLAPNR